MTLAHNAFIVASAENVDCKQPYATVCGTRACPTFTLHSHKATPRKDEIPSLVHNPIANPFTVYSQWRQLRLQPIHGTSLKAGMILQCN